jgi:hypothetical protein
LVRWLVWGLVHLGQQQQHCSSLQRPLEMACGHLRWHCQVALYQLALLLLVLLAHRGCGPQHLQG